MNQGYKALYNAEDDRRKQYADDQLDKRWRLANKRAKERKAQGKPMIHVVYPDHDYYLDERSAR